MSNIDFHDDHKPVYYLKGHKKIDWEEAIAQTEYFEARFKEGTPFLVLIDFLQARASVSLKVNRYMGKWSKKHRQDMGDYCKATAIIFKSHLLKLIVNPILSLMHLPNEVHIFNDKAHAERWLRERATHYGIEIASEWPAYDKL